MTARDLETALEKAAYRMLWLENVPWQDVARLLRDELPHNDHRVFKEERVRSLAKAERDRRFGRQPWIGAH